MSAEIVNSLSNTLRPIDEIPAAAALAVRRNQAITWLIDEKGVEYLPPAWLVRLIDLAERAGYAACQVKMRSALGLREPDQVAPTGLKLLAVGGEHVLRDAAKCLRGIRSRRRAVPK